MKSRDRRAERMSEFVTNMFQYNVTVGITRSEVIGFNFCSIGGLSPSSGIMIRGKNPDSFEGLRREFFRRQAGPEFFRHNERNHFLMILDDIFVSFHFLVTFLDVKNWQIIAWRWREITNSTLWWDFLTLIFWKVVQKQSKASTAVISHASR